MSSSLRARRRVGPRVGLLACLAVLGAAGSATLAALVATGSNTGNSVTSGTVSLTDNDGGTAMLSLTNATPGTSSTRCIQVTYGGSLSSTVRLFTTLTGNIARHVTLEVTRGTETTPNFSGGCSTFTPDTTNYVGKGAGVIYRDLLVDFPASYAAGLVDPTTGAPESWSNGESRSYRFVVTVNEDYGAVSQTGTAAFTWEARNQ